MSHYTVSVITKKGSKSEVEELLEPFNERIELPRYVLYTKEQLIQKGKENIKYIKNNIYKQYLKNPEEYKQNCIKRNSMDHYKFISDTFPNKMLKWTDEQIYEDNVRLYTKEDIGENGEVYSTYNNKAKWDWYDIGGRWNYCIPTKNGSTNCSLISDIILSADPTEEDKKNREDTWRSAKQMYKEDYFTERYGTLNEYINAPLKFLTYALLLPNGEWLEPGQMGPFGMSSASAKDEKDFEMVFEETLKQYKDYYLTVVDCHI